MSDQEISLALQERTVLGKGLNKLRNEGMIPAVIHDHGKPSITVQAEYSQIAKVYASAGKHHPVQLTVGDRKDMAIIKDVHYDPVKHRVHHVVFQAIRQDEKVETEVPIVIVGEVPAVKVGLLLINHLSTVEVEALPKDLPDSLEVDASGLAEIGDKIVVSQLVVPSGVTVLSEPEAAIASIEESKAQISEESSEEEAAAEAEEGAEVSAEADSGEDE